VSAGKSNGAALAEARRRIALRGYVTPTELDGLARPDRLIERLVDGGDVVRVGRSNLYAEPELAATLNATIAARCAS
jgi:hypothetical protein